MKFNTISEREITQKIIEYFDGKYCIKRSTYSSTSYENTLIINLNYDFKLYITVRFGYTRCYYPDKPECISNPITILFKIAHSDYIINSEYSEDNHSYLNEIENAINKLMDQIHTYEIFIKDFVDSVVDDLYNVEYHINLNTLHTYFKSDNGRAVIYPVIEFGHGGEYVTMYIDSIDGGKYPMKMYSSISFDDAKEMLDFYL